VVLACVAFAVLYGTPEAFDRAPRTFSRDGAQILPRVVSPALCDAVRAQTVREERDESAERGDINESGEDRWDIHLPLEGAMRDMLSEVWAKHWPTFVAALGVRAPDDISLVELSCLVTKPGAPAQSWHRDTDEQGASATRLLSVGIALQDITADMGPLEVVAGTHRDPTNGEPDPPVVTKMTCRKGDGILWDSTLFHRGGANSGSADRFVAYFTLSGRSTGLPDGSTYSLKKGLKVRGDAGPHIHGLFRG
jgi:hypothetical protein